MVIIRQAIKFARSVLSLCARVVDRVRRPTDDRIRGICSRLLTANDSDFESVVRELQTVLRRRLGLPMSSYRHRPDAGALAKGESKQRDKSAIVDNIARNERQKMALLVEHRHILDDISKELREDNCDLVERTKKLIAESKKSVAKRKSA